MKILKHSLFCPTLLWVLCFLLISCSGKSDTADPVDQTTTLRLQLDYYESRVSELESQLISAKAELYAKEIAHAKELQAIETAASAPDQTSEAEITTETPRSTLVWFHEKTKAGILITGVTGTESLLEIPSEIDGASVIGIGDNAFSDGRFSSVILPDGIKEIGWFAFSGCRNLTSITLPASVEKIEYGAFENCPKNLVFLCPEGSYAASYARSYGFAVKVSN